MRNVSNRKGFSLIELMIVVAIIGILAAIALPNFTRFQRKARQSEAKGLLGSYHTALKASAAEIGCFAGNFVAIGFQPEGELYYRINTVNNINVATSCVLPTATVAINEAACVITSATCSAVAGYAKTWSERSTTTTPTAGAGMTNNTYTATSSGNLGNTTANDEWRINEGKLLVNVTNGI